MKISIYRHYADQLKAFCTKFPILPQITFRIAIIAVILVVPNNRLSGQENEYTTFRFLSPSARQITITDTATLDEVLEIFRSNNITFNGPRPILDDHGTGKQETFGYRLTVELTTYNPGGDTNPRCPYKQITDMWYGLEGRLYQYNVLFFLTCIE